MRRILLAVLLAVTTLPAGFTAVGADPAPVESRLLNCSGDPFMGFATATGALEDRIFNPNVPIGNTQNLLCWGHIGHHTYFVGADGPLTFHGGYGSYTPAETGAAGTALVVSVEPAAEPGFAVELSLDGISWTLVRYVEIPSRPAAIIRSAENVLDQDLPSLPTSVLYENKPRVTFTMPDTGDAFRFLRVRQPKAFTGGLSSYADGGDMVVNVSALPSAPLPPAATRAEYDCASATLEIIFEAHPCRFGSTADYFDAASFTHTYWLGASQNLTRVSGSATFEPYRNIATVQQGEAIVTGVVETSPDGRRDSWTERAAFRALYGTPAPFGATFPAASSQFVRIRTEPHVLFTSPGTHHYAGFVTQSVLVVEGDVLAHARGVGDWADVAWTAHANAVAPPWPACPAPPGACGAYNGIFNG